MMLKFTFYSFSLLRLLLRSPVSMTTSVLQSVRRGMYLTRIFLMLLFEYSSKKSVFGYS